MARKPRHESYKTVREHFDKGWVHQKNLWTTRKTTKSIGNILRNPRHKKHVLAFFIRRIDKEKINHELKERIDYSIKILNWLEKFEPENMNKDDFQEYLTKVAKELPENRKILLLIIKTIVNSYELYESQKDK